MASSGAALDRAAALLRAREKEREATAEKMAAIAAESERMTRNIGQKFASRIETSLEAEIQQRSYGLRTLQEMKDQQEELQAARERATEESKRAQEAARKKRKKKKKDKVILSFSLEDEEDGDDAGDDADGGAGSADGSKKDGAEESDGPARKKARADGDGEKRARLKNPDVDTSFLPDRERERAEQEERKRLELAWHEQQEKIKKEEIVITYSYWDGSGHRKQVKLNKGNTIEDFLQACLSDLKQEFHELRGVTSESLMYVKEDLIMPSHYTFYDFIVTKARGKSGPLFSFDVHDDVRMVNDSSVEKEESHAGKVILRSWYERNKHIFPASRWEAYDPTKTWDKYTIKDTKEEKAEKKASYKSIDEMFQ